MTDITERPHATDGLARPVFVLAGPSSRGSLLSAMLGRNPAAYGLPETNLALAGTLDELLRDLSGLRGSQLHGLLRALAHLLSGEQTPNSIEMARRWIFDHLHWPTAWVFDFLRSRTTPLRLVERTTPCLFEAASRQRLAREFPQASYVHLVRHPRSQGVEMMKTNRATAMLLGSYDEASTPAVLDPQILWLRAELAIDALLQLVPKDCVSVIRAEDLVRQPKETLAALCEKLGLPGDDVALARMMHPEASPFASFGPLGAHLGDDPGFLTSPSLPRRDPAARLIGPLPWRDDHGAFHADVRQRAHALKYR